MEGSYFHVDHYLSAGTQKSVNGGELAAQALERLHGRIPRLSERRAAEANFVKRIMQTQSYGFHNVHVIEVCLIFHIISLASPNGLYCNAG